MAAFKQPLPSDIFKVGQVLNNTYDIKGVLGRGGTGEVYLARHEITQDEVAIKVLSSMFSGNEDYLELMKREQQMRTIRNDAVVGYNEISRTDQSHVYLVMDYIDGPSLNDAMMERRVEERELLVIGYRVLEGLRATHSQGIVHRDLSPDNIILKNGEAERATIIDFGIAKDTAAGARTIVGNEFAGKYEYAAPEQLHGNTDARSDLYALGASLLAAHRRQIPHVGNSPGEIVRVKSQPLSTTGMTGPLKELIEWLGAPESDERPQSAQEALDWLDKTLKPSSGKSGAGSKRDAGGKTGKSSRGEKDAPEKKRGMMVPLLGVLALAIAGGAGAYFSGMFAPSLPVAVPYAFSAGFDEDGSVTFAGNAPDVETATALSAAYTLATGTPAPAGALELATGMPTDDWPLRARELLELMQPLEEWSLDMTDTTATLTGLAPDAQTRDTLTEQLELWSAMGRMEITHDLDAGPRFLPVADVQNALNAVSTCGPLELPNAPAEGYGRDESITVTGDIANAADQGALQSALAPLLGDRGLRIDTTTLNEDLCAIRAVLPPVPANAVSIRLSQGATGEQNLTGVYRTGENPVVDIQIPSTIDRGFLWVMVVDNTGKVFHVLPNAYNEGFEITGLGEVEAGVRKVRVLHSVAEFQENARRLAMQVTDGDYGKSEVIAILSETPLFDIRRPRDEAVVSVAEALGEALTGREAEVLGVASRIIDARP